MRATEKEWLRDLIGAEVFKTLWCPIANGILSGRLRWHLPDIAELPDHTENFLGVHVIELILSDFPALDDFESFFLQVGDCLFDSLERRF